MSSLSTELTLKPAADRILMYLKMHGPQSSIAIGMHLGITGEAARDRRLFWVQGLNDMSLDQLYRRATVLLMASEGEGFGLPLVEAQRCGTPVAAAAIPALAEIAAGSAALFDPFSVDAIERALLAVLTSPGRLAELGSASRANALRYSWATTARRTLEIYQRIAA